MRAKYICQTASGQTYSVLGDTTESCDDIIGRCEQENDVEIADVVDEQFLDPNASMEDVLSEIAETEDQEELELEEEEVLESPSFNGMVNDVVEETQMQACNEEVFIMEVPDGLPASEVSFE